MNYFVELLLNIIICILISLLQFYLGVLSIRRLEKLYIKFRVPLREGHPKEYFKQNKLIKYIRKRLKLSTYDTLHYSIIILHYVHLVETFTPLCMFLLGVSVVASVSQMALYFGVLYLEAVVSGLIWNTHAIVKEFRCRKIRKTNPKYSKYSVNERWGFWMI